MAGSELADGWGLVKSMLTACCRNWACWAGVWVRYCRWTTVWPQCSVDGRFTSCVAVCQGELSRRKTDQIVSTLLEDLIAGVRTPERPRSPVDAYVTDEEIFRRRNPKVWRCHSSHCQIYTFGFSFLFFAMKSLSCDVSFFAFSGLIVLWVYSMQK